MFILLFVRFIQVVNLQIIKLSKVKLYWFQCIPQVHDISSTDALFSCLSTVFCVFCIEFRCSVLLSASSSQDALSCKMFCPVSIEFMRCSFLFMYCMVCMLCCELIQEGFSVLKVILRILNLTQIIL